MDKKIAPKIAHVFARYIERYIVPRVPQQQVFAQGGRMLIVGMEVAGGVRSTALH